MCDVADGKTGGTDIVRLDDIFSKFIETPVRQKPLNVGMIKIDVEGFERLVVAGGRHFLASANVPPTSSSILLASRSNTSNGACRPTVFSSTLVGK